MTILFNGPRRGHHLGKDKMCPIKEADNSVHKVMPRLRNWHFCEVQTYRSAQPVRNHTKLKILKRRPRLALTHWHVGHVLIKHSISASRCGFHSEGKSATRTQAQCRRRIGYYHCCSSRITVTHKLDTKCELLHVFNIYAGHLEMNSRKACPHIRSKCREQTHTL